MADLLQIQSMIDIDNTPIDQSALLYQTSTKNFQYTSIVRSFNGRTDVVTLSAADVQAAIAGIGVLPNQIYASPVVGTGLPTFRGLVPADLPVFIASGISHAAGIVPDPGNVIGTTKFLREDATWQVPAYPVTSVFGRTGNIVLNSSDVTTALGFTPINRAGDTGISGLLQITVGTATAYVIESQASGDTQPRFQLRGDARMEWGPGNAVTDFFISRSGLATGQLNFAGSGGASITFNLNGAFPNLDMHMSTGGVDAGIRMFNGSGTLIAQIDGNTAALYLETITSLPIRFATSNVVQWVLGVGGSFVSNQAALANNATTGFLGLPSVAGTPTGVPTNPGGGAPVYTVFDTTAGKLWVYFGGAWASVGGTGGAGTVTSVGLALPNIFTVSGSPITTAGTLTATFASQAANLVFASPNGASGVPTFRALVTTDLPIAIPNANLANSSLTVTAGNGLSGGGVVSLGGVVTLSLNQAFSPTWTAQHIFNYIPVTGTANNWSVRIAQIPFAQASGALVEIGDGSWSGAANSFSGDASVNGGTFVGINSLNAAFAGNYIDCQLAGISKFSVRYDGQITVAVVPVFPNQTTNKVFAAPNGSTGTPTFRVLAIADLPTAIPNANLANASVTVTAGSGLSGGGIVALGSSVSLSLNLGNANTWTATQTFSIPLIETPVVLTDAATVTLDASLGNQYRLTTALTAVTISAPINPTNGQKITIEYKNSSGSSSTLTLSTAAGGFAFGSDITAITATPNGLTDFIGAIYNSTAAKWRVVSYVKGF